MSQTKFGCMDLAQLWQLWKFQTNSQIKNWASNRSNLQWWNFVNMKVMDYNTCIYMHSRVILTLNPLFVCWKGKYKPLLCCLVIWWINPQTGLVSIHWFIAFLTWISCMNFTPETVKPKAWTFKEIKREVVKQEDFPHWNPYLLFQKICLD